MLTWTEIKLTMPPDLRKAHQANDKAAWEAYANPWHPLTSEPATVEYIMELYQQLTKRVDNENTTRELLSKIK